MKTEEVETHLATVIEAYIQGFMDKNPHLKIVSCQYSVDYISGKVKLKFTCNE